MNRSSVSHFRFGLLVAMAAVSLCAGVPVGTYLYTDSADLADEYEGGLVVRFEGRMPTLVIAYGRRYRKDRVTRKGTDEDERAVYKPFKAALDADRRTATFAGLPPDYYDLVILDEKRMRLWEGLDLLRDDQADEGTPELLESIQESLEKKGPGAVAWEAFFDTKQFERAEASGGRAAVFLQQMRLGPAVEESGAPIRGCIHSLDICWVEKARRDAGWQVITRQQLYREELPKRRFFRHHRVNALTGVRIGLRRRTLGPLDLPTEETEENDAE